jgi:hypothetical protein
MKITGFELHPFEIHVDANNHTLVKPSGTDKDGKQLHTVIGYYTNVAQALTKIAKIKVKEGVDVVDINTYIQTLKEITESIKPLNQ